MFQLLVNLYDAISVLPVFKQEKRKGKKSDFFQTDKFSNHLNVFNANSVTTGAATKDYNPF